MDEYEKLTINEYNEICSLLNIDPQTDISSVKLFDEKLNEQKRIRRLHSPERNEV